MKWSFSGPWPFRSKSGNIENSRKSVADRLLKDRMILLGLPINESVANDVIARMLFLQSESPDPIQLFINSPGGTVTDGLAIVDTIKALKAPVHTCCVGLAHSMAAVLLSCGRHGGRSCIAEGRVVFSQPNSGAIDGNNPSAEIKRFTDILIEEVAKTTGQPTRVLQTLFARSRILTAEQARRLRIVDRIENVSIGPR
jgi:ATP-dependent Clp protease protease subunit